MPKVCRGLPFALAVLCVCFASTPALGQTATLAWDPSPDAAGYVVRWGTTRGLYPSALDTGSLTSADIAGLTPGTTYWAVVEAYDTEGVHSFPTAALEFVAPLVCTYSLNAAAVNVAPGGGTGTLTVTAPTGCLWTPVSHSPFISFPDATIKSGTAIFAVAIAPNLSSEPRVGTATIGGLTFTVTQAGLPGDPNVRIAMEHARADFNGDGYNDLLWQDRQHGYLAAWHLRGGHAEKVAQPLSHTADDPNWRIAGTGDFNADGKPDIVWHHSKDGRIRLWYMDGVRRIADTAFSIEGISDTGWRIGGVGDFNGDSKPDLVWQHDRAGWLGVWLMDGTTLIGGLDLSPVRVDVEWKIAGVADMNGDGRSDLIWRNHRNGQIGTWLMDGVTRMEYRPLNPGAVPEQEWQIAAILDVNGDQAPDLVWHHATSGWIAVWYLNGTTRIGVGSFPVAIETNWRIAGPK